MYPKEYFLDRFKDEETGVLFHRYATGELTDEARAAILDLLAQRGMPEGELQALSLQTRKSAWRETKGTKECDFCTSSARFGAVMDEGQRFCSKRCLRNARLMEVSEDLAHEQIHARASQIKNGPCPVCNRLDGKVEVRPYHRVWSIGILTQWNTYPQVCCHACARKTNLGVVFCMLFGWWGVPWGILITPGQIAANLVEVFKARDEPEPSEALQQVARLELAKQLYKAAFAKPG